MENIKIDPNWKKENKTKSLSESYATIKYAKNASFLKKLFAFAGPGLMIAVGYMDPGNWATDLAGGASFGYTLLSVILISNIFAMFLQYLALKLGIVSGRDLAQACRDSYSAPISLVLWFLCEIAITACDLAEVIGSAIALNLLFKIPLQIGVLITALDVFIILYFQNKGFRIIESIIASLILVIIISFTYEIAVSNPNIASILKGFIPKTEIISNPNMLYIAIGILGATVMPHNLYLHSSIVQTREIENTYESKKTAIKFATLDSNLSLFIAFFINAAILILAASSFHLSGNNNVADIGEAYKLLNPILGVKYAAMFFGIALLASGLNSSLTGTIAGQIVMEGFLNIKLTPWLRRLLTRLLAIVPAIIITFMYGEKGVSSLLVLSQVILSMQLPFAIVPLISFTSNKTKMGLFVNKTYIKYIAWSISILIIVLNMYLLIQTVSSWLK